MFTKKITLFFCSLQICTLSFAQTSFSDVAASSGIDFRCFVKEMGGGCAFFDLNNDGLEDIYLTSARERDALYINNGDGTFSDITVAAGLRQTENFACMGVLTGDIDNDGYRDIFINTAKDEHSRLFLNNGDSTFTDISVSSGISADSAWAYSSSFGDYNNDGYIDIIVGNYLDTMGFIKDSTNVNIIGYQHQCSPNTLWLNNGDQTFTNVAATTGAGETGCNLSSVFTDYDNDNDVDIMNANDFGIWVSPNTLLQNNYPLNSFSDVSVAANANAAIYGMGIAVGDYDRDLDLDYYITNIGRNVLHHNNGNGTFTDRDSMAGVSNTYVIQDSTYTTGWGTGFMDIDNDGFLDLMAVNGFIQVVDLFETAYYDPDKLYHNNGDGTFTDISMTVGVDDSTVSRGFAYGDYDNDGDNDFLVLPVTNDTAFTRRAILHKNDLSNSNNWLKVKLQGTVSNRDGFGAHIQLFDNGISWVHEVNSGGSHSSQHSSVAHFGLGTIGSVDSVVVLWPSGLRQTLVNVSHGQQLTVIEGLTVNVAQVDDPESFQLMVYPNPAKEVLNIFTQNLNTEATLSIYSAMGNLVYQKNMAANASSVKINLSELTLSSGLYLISLKSENYLATKKILIY